MKRLAFCAVLILMQSVFRARAQTPVSAVNIIPKPVSLAIFPGVFILDSNTLLMVPDSADLPSAEFLNNYLQTIYGFSLALSKKATKNSIHLSTKKNIPKQGSTEKYTLQSSSESIIIEGASYAGTFYGIQSLIQLLPLKVSSSLALPLVKINDEPRFHYRGLLLDVARHFFPVPFIKKYLDNLALHKLNYFHWHLTDDQGWRIEIKKYPLLTKSGAYRQGTTIGRYPGNGNDSLRYGGFYTQDEVKEIVDYAAKRYITILPEIEMPGHSGAALSSYSYLGCTGGPYPVKQGWGMFNEVLCAGNDSVFNLLEGVLDEVIALFPSEYIHIGGDECPKDRWKQCAKCQQRIRDLHLKNEHELQSYFVQRIEKYVNGKGRKIIGWDEILEGGLAPNAAVMSWRGENGGIEAAKKGHDVIMTPESHLYFNYSQSKNDDSLTYGGYLGIEKVYGYEPMPAALEPDQQKRVMGAQACLWSEFTNNSFNAEYQLFPRVAALSEVLWSPKQLRSWSDFERRLQSQFKRYRLQRTNHSLAYYDLKTSIMPLKSGRGVEWSLETTHMDKRIVYTSDPDARKLSDYKSPLKITRNSNIGASLLVDGKPSSWVWQQFYINKATGKSITLSNPASKYYPGNDGPQGLVNGVLSSNEANISEWQGWYKNNLEAVIDLGELMGISSVSVHALQLDDSEIFFPAAASVWISTDGKNFQRINATSRMVKETSLMGNLVLSFDPNKARYVKILVNNPGPIPAGFKSAGNPAWILIDEIIIR